jgi:mannose/fructose/N-acetylgalactosamine-specific phosphotransferase system component IIC
MPEWLLIGFFLGGIAEVDSSEGWQIALSQPLATGWIAGLLSGQQLLGLMLGGVLQLFWIARMPVGAVRLSDFSSAGVCGVVLGIIAKTELGYSTTASMVVSLVSAGTASVLGGFLIHAARKWNDAIVEKVNRDTSLARLVAGGITRSFFRGGLLCVVVISVWFAVVSRLSGVEAFKDLSNSFPAVYAVSAFALGASLTLAAGRFRFVLIGLVSVTLLAVTGVI